MYSNRPRRNWGIIAVVSVLGISNLSLMNTLVSHKLKNPFPNINLPVGHLIQVIELLLQKRDIVSAIEQMILKILTRVKDLEEPKGLFGNKKTELHLRETYTMAGEGTKKDVEGTVMTDKDIACIKVEGSGNSTGKLVGASVGVKAAPAFSNIPIVGWLAAGFVTMFAQDKGSEIGGQIARDYNDC